MTFDDFQQLIAELSRKPLTSITEGASFRDDLGIDSLQMVNLMVRLTERFGIDISQIGHMGEMDTVGKMYSYFSAR